MSKDLFCGLFLLGIAIVVFGFMAWMILSDVCIHYRLRNTLKNHRVIIDAIYLYRVDLSPMPYEVDYSDMESVEETYKRFWDWGYKRILPPDKYRIIKPYIKKEK